jgi:hypothetical protein
MHALLMRGRELENRPMIISIYTTYIIYVLKAGKIELGGKLAPEVVL